jgi:3-keto-L-gulonate-6-phosphate decarboxylase
MMTRTQLQVALDFVELPRALAVAQAAVEGGPIIWRRARR